MVGLPPCMVGARVPCAVFGGDFFLISMVVGVKAIGQDTHGLALSPMKPPF